MTKKINYKLGFGDIGYRTSLTKKCWGDGAHDRMSWDILKATTRILAGNYSAPKSTFSRKGVRIIFRQYTLSGDLTGVYKG